MTARKQRLRILRILGVRRIFVGCVADAVARAFVGTGRLCAIFACVLRWTCACPGGAEAVWVHRLEAGAVFIARLRTLHGRTVVTKVAGVTAAATKLILLGFFITDAIARAKVRAQIFRAVFTTPVLDAHAALRLAHRLDVSNLDTILQCGSVGGAVAVSGATT